MKAWTARIHFANSGQWHEHGFLYAERREAEIGARDFLTPQGRRWLKSGMLVLESYQVDVPMGKIVNVGTYRKPKNIRNEEVSL